jgi:LemA protein
MHCLVCWRTSEVWRLGGNLELSYVVLAVAIGGVLLVAMMYNGLVARRNRVQSAWADIDVQLKRRHDLVPNLVESARGYIVHERQTLEAVTQARTQAISAGANVALRASAEMQLGGAISNLFAVAERYPALRATENMQLLQEQLTSTENRIAFARQHYNDTVLEYNTAVASFPRNLFARVFGFSAGTMFTAEESDRAVPQANLKP